MTTAKTNACDDSTLIKLALAGQVECFSALMDRHATVVKNRIRAMAPDGLDADDLVQDVFLKVWWNLSRFRAESTFRTWVMRIAINEVLQSIRRRKQTPPCLTFDSLDILPSQMESPHQTFACKETTQAVRVAVSRLPEKYCQVLILREFEELGERETADRLGISVAAAKTRLFRARRMLLGELTRLKMTEEVKAAA